MDSFLRLLYTGGLNVYALGARLLAAFGHRKAARWIEGQNNWEHKISALENESVIWMHCASLGEFEQGRPLIRAFQDRWPEYSILVSFFSPSGHEQLTGGKYDFTAVYLPLDTPSNAERFIRIVNPRIGIFVKYEFWIHILEAAKKRGIPLLLISAVLGKQHFRNPLYKKYLLRCLGTFSRIFVQDDSSLYLLEEHDLPVSKAGDTRIDRIAKLPDEARDADFSDIEAWIADRDVLICGSTWPGDERIIFSALKEIEIKNVAVLLVPHDTGEQHIRQIIKRCPLRTIRYSSQKKIAEADKEGVIVIDTVGLLSRLYRLGDIAYVGGGFETGLHNILEPAAFRKPILFGPDYESFPEAVSLVDRRAAFSITSGLEMKRSVDLLLKPGEQKRINKEISAYLQEHKGATRRILSYIDNEALLS